MFRSIQAHEIFDLNTNADQPAYWLAQLRKADWQALLKFAGLKAPLSTKKKDLAVLTLPHFEFVLCEGRGEVWQLWTELRHDYRVLLIQFRHSETDWSRGTPEFVDLEKNEPLGLVNIAARLLCRVK